MAGPKEGLREWSDAIPVPDDEMGDYGEDVWTTPLSEGRAANPHETNHGLAAPSLGRRGLSSS
jgi:hypothetical protein